MHGLADSLPPSDPCPRVERVRLFDGDTLTKETMYTTIAKKRLPGQHAARTQEKKWQKLWVPSSKLSDAHQVV